MIDFIDLPNDQSITRAEREYIDEFQRENEDPAKRHRVPIRCWDDATHSYRPAWFYEPSHEVLQSVISEITPIWGRTHVSPSCLCPSRYYQALAHKHIVESATHTYRFPVHTWLALKDQVPKIVLAKLKDLRGQVFFTQQDAADALVSLLQGVLTDTQIQQHGDVLMAALKETGDDDTVRTKRLAELQAILDQFYGNVPRRPMPPTDKDCPYCHLPYRYTFLEVLPYEQAAIQRMITLLVGAPIMLRDVPKVLEALELWIFAADAGLFSKKKDGIQTMTGMMLTTFKATLTEIRETLLAGVPGGIAPDATASSSPTADLPPPTIPDV